MRRKDNRFFNSEAFFVCDSLFPTYVKRKEDDVKHTPDVANVKLARLAVV